MGTPTAIAPSLALPRPRLRDLHRPDAGTEVAIPRGKVGCPVLGRHRNNNIHEIGGLSAVCVAYPLGTVMVVSAHFCRLMCWTSAMLSSVLY